MARNPGIAVVSVASLDFDRLCLDVRYVYLGFGLGCYRIDNNYNGDCTDLYGADKAGPPEDSVTTQTTMTPTKAAAVFTTTTTAAAEIKTRYGMEAGMKGKEVKRSPSLSRAFQVTQCQSRGAESVVVLSGCLYHKPNNAALL